MQWTVALPRGTLQTDMVERLLLRVPEAAEALGLSRAKTYQLVAGGELPSVRIGAAVRVPVDALRAWIERRVLEHKAA